MAVIILIRHGLTELTGKQLYGQSRGIHLSERGRGQAEALAERLDGVRLRRLYSSPLERCAQTAEPLSRALGIPAEPLDGVIEVDYGRWTGRTFAQLGRIALWRQMQVTPSSIRFPDGETLAEVQARAVQTIVGLAGRHAGEAVGVVTHGDIIRLSLAQFCGIHIDLYHRLEVAPASVSAVSFSDGIPTVVRINDTGTLADLAPQERRRRARRARPKVRG